MTCSIVGTYLRQLYEDMLSIDSVKADEHLVKSTIEHASGIPSTRSSSIPKTSQGIYTVLISPRASCNGSTAEALASPQTHLFPVMLSV